MVRYALVNTELEGENNPRLSFIAEVKAAVTTNGFPSVQHDEEISNDKRRIILPEYSTLSGH